MQEQATLIGISFLNLLAIIFGVYALLVINRIRKSFHVPRIKRIINLSFITVLLLFTMLVFEIYANAVYKRIFCYDYSVAISLTQLLVMGTIFFIAKALHNFSKKYTSFKKSIKKEKPL